MKLRELLLEFLLVFAVAFIVSSSVTFIYSLIAHSEGVFDWVTAFRFSLMFGIIIPWVNYREKKKLKSQSSK